MTSCEPARSSAYSEDLRWRIVWQREALELTFSEIASNLLIDVATAHRVVKQFTTSGSISKKSYSSTNRPCKLTKPVQLTILHLVLEKPSMYLWEIQQELQWLYALDISPSTICMFLKKSNFSRKKMQLIASQRDKEIRSMYQSEVSLYESHFIIFIDETGCDRRHSLRKYGYGLRGRPVRCQKLLVRGKYVSVIAAMTIHGLLDLKVVQETVTGDIFIDFIERQLLPHLMTFNGHNSNSVIILDNCSVHHVPGVTDAIEDVGALVHYLPPYSPDLNPIEMLFSKVKLLIRQMEIEMSATTDIESIVLAAFSCISAADCVSWIKSCDIYN